MNEKGIDISIFGKVLALGFFFSMLLILVTLVFDIYREYNSVEEQWNDLYPNSYNCKTPTIWSFSESEDCLDCIEDCINAGFNFHYFKYRSSEASTCLCKGDTDNIIKVW